jgi:uncharacterized membrane protein
MMGYYLKLYFATLVAFFAIDLVWLSLVARTFYHKYFGFLMAPSVNWPAALIFYLLFVVGLVVFAVLPGLEAGSLKMTVGCAALIGLIAYATYDLTNLATLKDWPLIVTAVDLAWGTVLSVAVSCVGYLAGKWLS